MSDRTTWAAEARRVVIKECAKIAETPYSDEVDGRGYDEPLAIGKKIAKAIRALLAETRKETT